MSFKSIRRPLFYVKRPIDMGGIGIKPMVSAMPAPLQMGAVGIEPTAFAM